MPTDPNPQNLSLAQRETVDIVVALSPVADISGWSITFTARDHGGVVRCQKTVGSGITITNGEAGEFTISLSSADTSPFVSPATLGLKLGEFDYDIWRTDSGSEKRLAWGELFVDKQFRV